MSCRGAAEPANAGKESHRHEAASSGAHFKPHSTVLLDSSCIL